MIEYIIFCYGVWKGLVDIVLCIVDVGYLIWCLVDVVYSLVIIIFDCKLKYLIWLIVIKENNKVIYFLEIRFIGCVLVDDVFINYLELKIGFLIKELWLYFKKYK